MTWWHVLDVVLALGATARLARLIITDEIGRWYVVGPILRWAQRTGGAERAHWWDALLGCPFCIGYWIGCAVLGSLWLVGGPGEAWEPWRWGAATLTLNYVAAHLGSRLGDVN